MMPQMCPDSVVSSHCVRSPQGLIALLVGIAFVVGASLRAQAAKPIAFTAVKTRVSRRTWWSANRSPCDIAPRGERSGEPESQCVRYDVPKA